MIKLLYSKTNINDLLKFGFLVLCFFNIINYKNEIELDNEFPIIYEKNINFSNYTSNIKPIALYYPEFDYFNVNYTNLSCKKDYNFNTNNNFVDINFNKKEIIKNQVELAKSHGIYGFAINFVFDFKNTYIDDISLFLSNEEIKFPFLLIWENNNFNDLLSFLKNKIANKNEKKLSTLIFKKFVNQIQKFLIHKLYIKFNNKPILVIENSLIFGKKDILKLRTIIKSRGIGKIFLICRIENYNLLNGSKSFNAFYDLPKMALKNNTKLKIPILYYYGMIYKNIKLNQLKYKSILFRTSLIEINHFFNEVSLKFYSPEKFYILNKVIIEWTKNNYCKTQGYFFINSWNDYGNGNYLEPDEIYGYASLNSFSKALFNLSYNEKNYNYLYLNNNCFIAIQAHIFFEDLSLEIINKTNNIPFKYDLFITTISVSKKIYIEQILKKYSKAHLYEVRIVENKGRDVLPFIVQMKSYFKRYKYICHIHSKKSQKFPITGNMWRQYLYKNLLGSEEIISEIINDFEKNDYLGFIFPDTYYNIVNGVKNFESIDFKYHMENIDYINFVIKRMFGNYNISRKLIFPAGDMFWAKTDAIHQIFEIKFLKLFPKEIGQLNKTLMHAIERLWLYLVRLNGYYYKTIFKIY